jgi:hypothetical protein
MVMPRWAPIPVGVGFFPQSWSSRTFRVCRRRTALSSYWMTGDEHRSNAIAIFSETWPTPPAQSPRSTGSIRAGASTPGPRPTQPLFDSDTASGPHVIVAVSSFFFRSTRDTRDGSNQPTRRSDSSYTPCVALSPRKRRGARA